MLSIKANCLNLQKGINAPNLQGFPKIIFSTKQDQSSCHSKVFQRQTISIKNFSFADKNTGSQYSLELFHSSWDPKQDLTYQQ